MTLILAVCVLLIFGTSALIIGTLLLILLTFMILYDMIANLIKGEKIDWNKKIF